MVDSLIRTQGSGSALPLKTTGSLAVLLLAGLLATVFSSWGVFLLVLGAVFIPLVAIWYPAFTVGVFLFLNLLSPKLPLIAIRDYMVPIKIEDVFLGCALLSLSLTCITRRTKPARNPLQVWMLAYSVVTGLSLLYGLFILRSVPGAKIGSLYWLRGPEYFAASYLCLLGVTTWKQYRHILASLVAFVFLVGVYGILQEFSLVPIFDASHNTGDIVEIRFFPAFGQDRLFSTFAGPYDLSATYLIVIPIFIALLVLVASGIFRMWIGGVLGLSFFCFYLAFARTPLAALVIVLGVCLWMLGKRSMAFILALLCVVPPLFFSGYVDRLVNAADNPFGAYNLGSRAWVRWVEALAAVSRSPILGTGPASFGQGMGADGLYFTLLGMWGIAGLVCFLILIGKAMQYQGACVRNSGNRVQRALAIGLFAGTIGLLLNGLTLDSFFSSKVALSYWFLVGLLFAGNALENRIPLAENSLDRKPALENLLPQSGGHVAPASGGA